jgi:hypothetical protein
MVMPDIDTTIDEIDSQIKDEGYITTLQLIGAGSTSSVGNLSRLHLALLLHCLFQLVLRLLSGLHRQHILSGCYTLSAQACSMVLLLL